jgi:hypothetical protein
MGRFWLAFLAKMRFVRKVLCAGITLVVKEKERKKEGRL